jgi:Protein of unknown function (DUF3987)
MARLLKKPWLEAYLDYIDSTENPTEYNLWCGISAISATLKRRVYVWRNFIQFFPNQYIVLVGPPGIGKGASIKPAVDIVEEANTVNYLSDKITAERIIQRLADGFAKVQPTVSTNGGLATVQIQQDHTATILSKELPVFLSSSEWLHSLMCQLWDENKFEYETKNKGAYKITEMCVSMLAACVPEFIRSLSRDSMAAITGGFTARTIFVYASEKARLIPGGWGRPVKQITQLRSELINDLIHISQIEGEMKLDPVALQLWDMKYKEHNAKADFDSDVSANFKSRLSSHIIKTAITISISESDSLIITAPQLLRAIELVEAIRDKVDIVFRSVGESPLAFSQDLVMTFIQKQGLVSREAILRATYRHLTDEQLSQVIFVLLHAGFIVETTQDHKTLYKSTQ